VRLPVASERAYTLIEMLTVLVIFGTVMSALLALFVQGTNAELSMNNRFQAQQEARLGLDRLRRDVHCASTINQGTALSSFVTLTVPCVAGQTVTWCTIGSGQRYGLYRSLGTTCTAAAGGRYADHLTAGAVFSQQVQSSTSLWTLHVDLPVNVAPKQKSTETYELVDDIVLRNSTRTCITGSPSPSC
jgi:prepilin-type N-terminal cleavage/methylation domain-containing protein